MIGLGSDKNRVRDNSDKIFNHQQDVHGDDGKEKPEREEVHSLLGALQLGGDVQSFVKARQYPAKLRSWRWWFRERLGKWPTPLPLNFIFCSFLPESPIMEKAI